MAIRKRIWTSSDKERQAWIVDYYATSPRTGKRSRIVRQFKSAKEARDFEAKARVEKKAGKHVAEPLPEVSDAIELWTCRCGKTLLPIDFKSHTCEAGPSPFHVMEKTS